MKKIFLLSLLFLIGCTPGQVSAWSERFSLNVDANDPVAQQISRDWWCDGGFGFVLNDWSLVSLGAGDPLPECRELGPFGAYIPHGWVWVAASVCEDGFIGSTNTGTKEVCWTTDRDDSAAIVWHEAGHAWHMQEFSDVFPLTLIERERIANCVAVLGVGFQVPTAAYPCMDEWMDEASAIYELAR